MLTRATLSTKTKRFKASDTVGTGNQQQERKKPGTSECSMFGHKRTNRQAHRAYSTNWDRPVRTRTPVEASAQYGTRNALKLCTRTLSTALSSDGWLKRKEFRGKLSRAGHVTTTTCHGDDSLVEPRKDRAKSKRRDEATSRPRGCCHRTRRRQPQPRWRVWLFVSGQTWLAVSCQESNERSHAGN